MSLRRSTSQVASGHAREVVIKYIQPKILDLLTTFEEIVKKQRDECLSCFIFV